MGSWERGLLLCCLLWCSSTYALVDEITLVPPYNIDSYDKALSSIIRKVQQSANTTVDKVAAASHAFIGQPYRLWALGEGLNGEFDQSPLYRTDAFDCLSYVATVIAIVRANDITSFKSTIAAINYRNSIPSFQNRNHFMTLDWNPNNAAKGYIRDITSTITDEGKKITLMAEAQIDKAGWYAKRYPSDLHLIKPLERQDVQTLLKKQKHLGAIYHKQKGSLPYIPLAALFDKNHNPRTEIFDQIPTGSIIEIVRPNWDLTQSIGTHLNVSHVGFAIKTRQGLMFRHASSIEKKIVDVSLPDYLKDFLDSPTAKGINVQIILAPRVFKA